MPSYRIRAKYEKHVYSQYDWQSGQRTFYEQWDWETYGFAHRPAFKFSKTSVVATYTDIIPLMDQMEKADGNVPFALYRAVNRKGGSVYRPTLIVEFDNVQDAVLFRLGQEKPALP